MIRFYRLNREISTEELITEQKTQGNLTGQLRDGAPSLGVVIFHGQSHEYLDISWEA